MPVCDTMDMIRKPPWPNGQGVGPLIRRLRVRVPQEVRMSWIYGFLLLGLGKHGVTFPS